MLALLLTLLAATPWPDPWAARGSGDVEILSTGEVIPTQDEILTDGKYTVLDVGAPWCAPCHDAARALRGYAEGHPDTAIRVVTLDGTPAQSMAAPAAVLAERGSLPWLVVYAPDGERVYAGNSPAKALKKLDRARRKDQRSD
ncbi:MAG: thioredoxin family protein [Myxococcota bacterium]|nr:thioredoxin family protein [Myxococcota bacterium]